MKKAVLAIILIIASAFSMTSCLIEDNGDSYEWIIEEKSHFVDYKIEGEKIKFRYSIYMISKYDEDQEICFGVKFKPEEIAGWVESEDVQGDPIYFDSDYAILKAHSKGSVIFTFEGKYLGGKVNTALSYPEVVLMSEGNVEE